MSIVYKTAKRRAYRKSDANERIESDLEPVKIGVTHSPFENSLTMFIVLISLKLLCHGLYSEVDWIKKIYITVYLKFTSSIFTYKILPL